MSYRMRPEQLKNVFSLGSQERYEHFIIKACDWEEVWLLKDSDDVFLTLNATDNIEYLPVWPHSKFALAFSEGVYSSYTPYKVSINSFIESLLPDVSAENIQVGVLPNMETTVWIISANDLREEIILELQQHV